MSRQPEPTILGTRTGSQLMNRLIWVENEVHVQATTRQSWLVGDMKRIGMSTAKLEQLGFAVRITSREAVTSAFEYVLNVLKSS
jgi:hypothetical protein